MAGGVLVSIRIRRRFEQPEKTELLMDCMLCGMDTDVRPLQLVNAADPIEVTVEGMV